MIEIKDLLNKFDHLLFSGELKKDLIKKAVKEAVGIEIQNDDIEIKNNTLYLNVKPIYKNEIFLKKDQLQAKLEEFFGKKIPKTIR